MKLNLCLINDQFGISESGSWWRRANNRIFKHMTKSKTVTYLSLIRLHINTALPRQPSFDITTPNKCDFFYLEIVIHVTPLIIFNLLIGLHDLFVLYLYKYDCINVMRQN